MGCNVLAQDAMTGREYLKTALVLIVMTIQEVSSLAGFARLTTAIVDRELQSLDNVSTVRSTLKFLKDINANLILVVQVKS